MSISILSILELAPPYYPRNGWAGNLDLYSYGYDTKTGFLNLVSLGHGVVTGSLDLYSLGRGGSTSGLNLVCNGAYPTIESGLNLFTQGFSYTVTGSLDMYAYVSNVGASVGGVNLFAKVAEGSGLDCYCPGPGTVQIGTINMVASGGLGKTGSINMVIGSSREAKIGTITLYSRGW